MVDRAFHSNFRYRVSCSQHFNMPSSASSLSSLTAPVQMNGFLFVMVLISLQHSLVFLFTKNSVIRFLEGICWHFTFVTLFLRLDDSCVIDVIFVFILVAYIVFKFLRMWTVFSAISLLTAQLALIMLIFHATVFVLSNAHRTRV